MWITEFGETGEMSFLEMAWPSWTVEVGGFGKTVLFSGPCGVGQFDETGETDGETGET